MSLRRVLDPTRTGKDAEGLEQTLLRLVIGQDEAIQQIVNLYQTHVSGLCAPGRPVGSLLFLGPTGTGKTRVVEATAEALVANPRAVVKIDCAEFQHSHEIAKLIGCFIPETPILMGDGSRKPIADIQVGDEVITKEGRVRPVTYLHEYQQDGDMLEIQVSSHNQPLVTTKGHKILAIPTNKATGRVRCPKDLYCPDNLQWVPAGELQKNDVVAYPRFQTNRALPQTHLDLMDYLVEEDTIQYDDESVWFTPSCKTKRWIAIDEDFVRFAGYFVSDGCTRNNKGGIHFTLGVPQKAEVISDLMVILPRIFGIDKEQVRLVSKGKNCERVIVSSKVLAILTAQLFGKNTLEKRIPSFLLHLSDALLWHLIDAAIMCDGSVVVRRRVDYSTSSETLYSQLQLLLRKLGFTTQAQRQQSVRYGKRGADRYRIYIAGEQIDRFAYQLPVSGKKINLENPGNGGIQRMSHVDDKYVYFRVKSIGKRAYQGPVYDFSVAEDTSYVAESIIVSNSPPGYLGHRETHPLLSQQVIDQHHTDTVKISFVLFDEIEKASDSLWNLLLGILDKATLTLGDNRKVDFSKALIFMTSNLGAKEMENLIAPKLGFGKHTGVPKSNNQKVQTSGLEAARRKFTPEFMNRIDKTVVFKSLGEPELRRILDLELNQVQQRILLSPAAQTFVLRVSGAARQFLLTEGTDSKYGARHLRRAIERLLVHPLSNLMATSQVVSGDCIDADFDPEHQSLFFTKEAEGLETKEMVNLICANSPMPAVETPAFDPTDSLKTASAGKSSRK